MVILGLYFLLIKDYHLDRGWGSGWVRLKLDVQGQGGGRILVLAGQRGGGLEKLENFHGSHMCIIRC